MSGTRSLTTHSAEFPDSSNAENDAIFMTFTKKDCTCVDNVLSLSDELRRLETLRIGGDQCNTTGIVAC